jgi:hypothetical protein
MTELVTPSIFSKDYLPGYTGHVPSKQERFGASIGHIKKEIHKDQGFHPVKLYKPPSESDRIYSDKFTPTEKPN